VRIDDLREPRRSPEEQSLFDLALRMQVDLDADGVVGQARAATGLDDLGDTGLVDRLRAR
jgi:hypothetical protein